jgi:hypothetical protein
MKILPMKDGSTKCMVSFSWQFIWNWAVAVSISKNYMINEWKKQLWLIAYIYQLAPRFVYTGKKSGIRTDVTLLCCTVDTWLCILLADMFDLCKASTCIHYRPVTTILLWNAYCSLLCIVKALWHWVIVSTILDQCTVQCLQCICCRFLKKVDHIFTQDVYPIHLCCNSNV